MIDTHHSASFSRNEGFRKKTFMTSVAAILMSLWHCQIMKHLPHQQTLRPRYGCTVSSGFFRPAGPTCKQIHQMIGSHMNFWNGLVENSKLGWNYMRKSCSLGLPNCAVRQYTTPDPIQMTVVSEWDHSKTNAPTLLSKCALFFAVVGTPNASHIHT